MITMDHDLQFIHHGALQRQVRQRVDWLDELRTAKNAADRILTQREIAGLLATSQAKAHRLLKAIERRRGNLIQDAEEIMLRALPYDTSREKLVEKLKAFPYTFGEEGPFPHDGRLPGTWDQVIAAYAQGMLNEEELDEARVAVGR